MNEHGFIRYVHSKLDPKLVKWKIHDSGTGGVPDAFYMGEKSDLWIEYKYVKSLPVRPSTIVKTCLTELQKIWLDDLERCKRPCALAIGCGTRVAVLVKGAWNIGITSEEFSATSIDRKELARWIKTTCL